MKGAVILGGLAAVTTAHPKRAAAPSNGDVVLGKRGVDLTQFTIPGLGDYTKANDVEESQFRLTNPADYVAAATRAVKDVAPNAEFRVVEDHYIGASGIAHVNFKQTAHNLDIDNADFTVNVRRDGSILSHGGSFFEGAIPAEPPLRKRDFTDPVTALQGVVEALNLPIEAANAVAESNLDGNGETYTLANTSGAVKDPEAKLVYMVVEGTVRLVWRVETDVMDNWLLTYVDASTTTEVIGVVDYVSDLATYEVYPWNVNDPTWGKRIVVEDPWLDEASKFTWQGARTNEFWGSTIGNNGQAQINAQNTNTYVPADYRCHPRPSSADMTFEYPYSIEEIDPTVYQDASVAQLFYSSNMIHDVLYTLGFTEEAGNFQLNNNGMGGRDGDTVILNAQDGSGMNNANFGTPPDGQPARMRMYLWNRTEPIRDCSFDASVVIHEYIHGLSNRLTGGPLNAGCLPTGEPGGMGEGWSDFFATAIRLQPGDTRETDYPMGDWVSGNPVGIRTYVYSTDMTTNPHTYGDIDFVVGVHRIGTIWATILYEVLWNLIDIYGKNDAFFPDLDENNIPTDGKFLTLKLVQEGMALQPCRPDFIAARDAILDADLELTDGVNACAIWKGFAKRGLGPRAIRFPRVEDFDLPAECL